MTSFQGTIGSTLDGVFSWLSNGGSSSLVPTPFVVAINGRPYLHDLEFKPWKRQAMRATTTQTTRTQADSSNEPGEQSLSTEQLWRRTQDSWHFGAGQTFLDRKTSSEFSFRASKGIDCWTQWQLELLPHTVAVETQATSAIQMVVCNNTLYYIDGQHLIYCTLNGAGTTVTGTPAVTASSICTDGHNVYVALRQRRRVHHHRAGSLRHAAGDHHRRHTPSSGSSWDGSWPARTSLQHHLYHPGRAASGIMQSTYSNLVWNDLTAGNGVIFASGNSVVVIIYSIQIQSDGTSLSSPIICGQLPNGETVNAIYGYAGSGVVIGTSRGWRFAEQALANGVAGTVSLTIGPVTLVPGGCTCFSGFDRFVWTNYDNYDTQSTGLIRIDPSVFTADLTPAWATDRMYGDPGFSKQGHVNSIVHYASTNNNFVQPVPVFAVSGVGIVTDDTTFVASGTIDSGFITYGLADNKRPVFVDLTFDEIEGDIFDAGALGEAIITYVSLDGGN